MGKKVAVTGGAGFIGSKLVESLIKLGAEVTVVDNLSSGSESNLLRVGYLSEGQHLPKVELENLSEAVDAMTGQEIVFHLAANIGGREYITTHPADCSEGFAINQNTIKAAQIAKVNKVIFASSACVYPVKLQDEYDSNYKLKETDAWNGKSAGADLNYGWAKLMGEQILEAYHEQYGLLGASVRYVTVYGPYENDTHAIIALMKRALNHEDPYLIWGSGLQDRDFTFVDDIVLGTLAVGAKIKDHYDVFNIGTGKRYPIKQVCEMIFEEIGWHPQNIRFDQSKPEGVKTRALDMSKTSEVVGWHAQTDLKSGIKKTLEWLKNENRQH